MFSSFGESLSLIKSSRKVKFLSSIPFLISVIFYSVLGKLIFVDLKDFGVSKIESYFSTGSGLSVILTSLLVFLLTILLFLIVNWTFVLLVSLFASPINDLLSEHIERLKNGSAENALSDKKRTFNMALKRAFAVLKNETKKVSLILILMVVSFVLSFIPPLTVVGPILSFILISVQFVDYSWSRHNLDFSSCINDIKKNFFIYLISGAIFFFFFSLPYVNVIFIPFGVVYYSVLWQNFKKIESH